MEFSRSILQASVFFRNSWLKVLNQPLRLNASQRKAGLFQPIRIGRNAANRIDEGWSAWNGKLVKFQLWNCWFSISCCFNWTLELENSSSCVQWELKIPADRIDTIDSRSWASKKVAQDGLTFMARSRPSVTKRKLSVTAGLNAFAGKNNLWQNLKA